MQRIPLVSVDRFLPQSLNNPEGEVVCVVKLPVTEPALCEQRTVRRRVDFLFAWFPLSLTQTDRQTDKL